MKTIRILLLTLFVSTTAAGQSVDREPSYALITGTGQFSCGQFMEYKTQNIPQQMDLVVQWVWGFISAYNARGNFEKKFKRPTAGNLSTMPDSPTVLLFLGNYCQKHTLDSVLDAWSSPVEGSNKRRFFAVLHQPPVTSPVEVMRAAIVTESRGKK